MNPIDMTDKTTTLNERFGPFPNESGLTHKMRLHQGWWRTNVLCEEAGPHPIKNNEEVCNVISDGEISQSNFLSENGFKAAEMVLAQRGSENLGIVEPVRLFNNLLSSQPLCFNFFGELKFDRDFGLQVLRTFYEDLTALNDVFFEFAPKENYTKDNSAFDIAFEVMVGDRKGLIGLECKYTDTFSYKPSKSNVHYGDKGNKNHDTYLSIYNSAQNKFASSYYDFVQSKDFNQLFRNQLIAESLITHGKYDFVRTGLFCYQQDSYAIETARTFKSMLSNPDQFKLITYSDFIGNTQRLELDWRQREWSMLLWARYCGTALSSATISKLKK